MSIGRDDFIYVVLYTNLISSRHGQDMDEKMDYERIYTPKELENMSLSELTNIKLLKADLLVKEKQKRFHSIAAILFYQQEIKKEREN